MVVLALDIFLMTPVLDSLAVAVVAAAHRVLLLMEAVPMAAMGPTTMKVTVVSLVAHPGKILVEAVVVATIVLMVATVAVAVCISAFIFKEVQLWITVL